MKPLNLDNRPCSPISSNCVIWQGPDIPCIKLCTGDTISDVVFKLATELCTIMDQLKVSNYDLTCLNLNACPPDDFQALIQLLIDKVCELNGIPTGTEKSAGCPDCVISVAQCLKEADPSLPATMQLIDYVQMLAGKICSILSDINIINSQITNLDNRVTILENTPPPTFTLPSIDTSCLAAYIPGAPAAATIDLVLDALVNNDIIGYCELINATGFPDQLLQAVATQCIENTSLSLASKGAGDSPVKTMSAQYGPYSGFGTWNSSPVTVADAINNIWISICDIYSYVSTFSKTVVAAGSGVTVTSSTVSNTITYTVAVAPSVPTVQDTTTINLTNTSGTLSADVQDTGWKCLLGFDHYSDATDMIIKKPQVRRIGNVLHFRGLVTIPLASYTTGNLVEFYYKSGTNTYEGQASFSSSAHGKNPYAGVGGVTLTSGGDILFNQGASVIPTSVLPSGYSLDGNYSVGWRIGWRSMDTGSCSTVLSTLGNLGIGSTGTLIWGTVANMEESFVSGCNPGAFGTSHLNYIISNVKGFQDGDIPTVGDFVPKFSNSLTTIYDSSVSGQQNLDLYFSTTERYPITINANVNSDLGGFQMVLDGLTAFIGPCVTTIPTPVLDANACAGTCPVG